MHRLILLFMLATGLEAVAQTGPGGVGTAANNVLWLSADNGVLTSGVAVTDWIDRSGNFNNATSPSVPACPTLMASVLNGYPMLGFDGVSSEMFVGDVASLDLSQWDTFFVGAENAPKANNSWFAKGTTAQPNYALWSLNTDALQMPIYDIFGLLSSPITPAGITGASYSVLEYNNTIFFGLFPSRTIYRGGVNMYNDANLLQLPVPNNNPLYIGNVQGTTGWNLDGTLGELIMYNAPINTAQRIIINNYLAAKYGLALGVNDIYVQDNPANGNYDHEVAGIGRISSSSLHNNSRGSAVVQINNPTGLGNNEFLIWGHDNGLLGAWGSTDLPVGVQGRWFRVWRVNEVSPTNAPVDVGAVDMTFDLTNQGPVTASDLRLLVDINNNGIFADDMPVPIMATAVGGNLYRFAGVTALVNNRRFTLGTINLGQTPLPVELLHFSAIAENNTVQLTWATATEHDNDHFTIERSASTVAWESVVQVPGAGNSSSLINYAARDPYPLPHLSYYRLQQTDVDGGVSYSQVVAVRIDDPMEGLTIFPTPAQDLVNIIGSASSPWQELRLLDGLGRSVKAPMAFMDGRASIDVSALPAGDYLVMVITQDGTLKERLVVVR